MSEPANVTPVYLLTGFLGSGKTTLLRRLVDDAQARGMKLAVLMNEVGDVNLDGLLVDTEVPMAEMLGGCICCTIRGDLGLELTQLARKYAPDVIWIESTGVAQPMEILDAVTEASFYHPLALAGVVAVADARHLLDRVRIGSGQTYRLMRDQIRAASLVVLNKTDLVGEAERQELAAQLEAWNPGADKLYAVRAAVDPARIYEAAWHGSPASAAVGCADTSPDHVHDASCGHDHGQGHGHAHAHVQVVTHYLQGAMDSHAFERFVEALPAGVYRAKGIVTFRDTASKYLFQYAWRQSDFLPLRPDQALQDVLVFIGEDYRPSDIEDQLRALTAE